MICYWVNGNLCARDRTYGASIVIEFITGGGEGEGWRRKRGGRRKWLIKLYSKWDARHLISSSGSRIDCTVNRRKASYNIKVANGKFIMSFIMPDCYARKT